MSTNEGGERKCYLHAITTSKNMQKRKDNGKQVCKMSNLRLKLFPN